MMPEPQTESGREPLAGLVERVTFHSPDSGFCVLRVLVRGHREPVTVIGSVAAIQAGEQIQASGTWENHRDHGLQFKAAFMRSSLPTTLDGIEKYLGSGLIKGIGPHFAKRLVAEFGEGVFDLIEVDLKSAAEAVQEEAYFSAAALASRALLVTRGEQSNSDKESFELFLKHFIQAGLVDDRFQPLVTLGARHYGLQLLSQKGAGPGHRDEVALLLELGRVQGERGQFQHAEATLGGAKRFLEHEGDRHRLVGQYGRPRRGRNELWSR